MITAGIKRTSDILYFFNQVFEKINKSYKTKIMDPWIPPNPNCDPTVLLSILLFFLITSVILLVLIFLSAPVPSTRSTKYKILKRSSDEKKFTLRQGEEYIDHHRPLKDLCTTMVTNEFLSSEKTLDNFLRIVFENVENVLSDIRKRYQLLSKDLFLLFKGGNYMRLFVFLPFLNHLPKASAYPLEEYYDKYFQPSDNDFSIYINPEAEEKYTSLRSEVLEAVFEAQRRIRSIILSKPEQYFEFYRLNTTERRAILQEYLQKANDLTIFRDPNNTEYYRTILLAILLENDCSATELDREKLCSYLEYTPRPDFIITEPE
ncbi:hypothetical protein EBS02_12745, partial [bacterium]|nr:hypothetical protein [bacterium]